VKFRFFLGLISAAMVLATSGCSSVAGWSYDPNPATAAPASNVPLVVAVPHFEDERAEQNKTWFWLCVIPAVPYCTAMYHRPENANGFQTAGAYDFRPSEDLSSATVRELRNTGMFKEVYATERDSAPGAQLVLRGTIESTDWEGTRTSYGLAGDGDLLWLLGLPIGTVDDHMKVKLQLVEQASGRELWSYDIDEDYKKTEGIYYNYAEDFGYPQMYRDGMSKAMSSLRDYVASKPPGFWQRLAPPEP
jgi:hypothetical protein